jgi:hypothetical protein
MDYTEMRLQNEAYQSRVDSAWEQRDRAQAMARFAVPNEGYKENIPEQIINQEDVP